MAPSPSIQRARPLVYISKVTPRSHNRDPKQCPPFKEENFSIVNVQRPIEAQGPTLQVLHVKKTIYSALRLALFCISDPGTIGDAEVCKKE